MLASPLNADTATLQEGLVAALDDAVRPYHRTRPVVDAVVDALTPFLHLPDLLTPEQRIGDPTAYSQRVLHVADGVAVSLHVYGADLRLQPSSIRRRYDQPVVARQPPTHAVPTRMKPARS